MFSAISQPRDTTLPVVEEGSTIVHRGWAMTAALAVVVAMTIGGIHLWQRFGPAPVVEHATTRPGPDVDVPPAGSDSATILAAGDIAACNGGAAATAELIRGRDGVVAALGDLAYNNGTLSEFEDCYLPTWGRFLDRTRPTQGNHDVRTAGAAGYFEVFGDRAGPEPQGYYSYQLGSWHVVVLNSNCEQVGGCGPDSPQVAWLRDDLTAAGTGNILTYWHHPRWSTGSHGDNPAMDTIWRTLADAGADIVLSGHDHDYQRFAPLDADGQAAGTGLRAFVVGTGGKSLRDFDSNDDRVQYRQNDQLGIVELDLEPCGYRWAFHVVDGSTSDRGETTGTC